MLLCGRVPGLFKASSHAQILECLVLDGSIRTGVNDITLITINSILYRSLFGVVHFFQPDLFISGFKYRVLHCLLIRGNKTHGLV